LPALGPARESGSVQQARRTRAIAQQPVPFAPTDGFASGQAGRQDAVARSAGWALAILTLGLAYSQSPLFSSNQNQYFLHGAARAGIGFLRQDWLAGTADPTPVFTGLVEWTYRLLPPAAFHLEYLLLFGVYLAGLWLLADTAFGLRATGGRTLLFLVLVVALHSAALRLIQSRLLGESWEYLWDGGVAGQRLLGPVFQPSTFGVLLLLSLGLFVRGRAAWAVAAAALAASVHPTYLLPAAILVLAYCLVLWREEHSLRRPALLGMFALVLVAPIVLYVILALGPTSPERIAEAQNILVRERVPHHALPAVWFDATVLVKLALVGLALLVTRTTRLARVLALTVAAGLLLTAIQILTGSEMLALLFPWRISAVLVPAGVGLLAGWCALRGASAAERLSPTARRGLALAGLAVLALLAVSGGLLFAWQTASQAQDPAAPMLSEVRRHLGPGQVYLIPPKLQEFRLVTGAPALVDFKSIPYRDVDVLEWRQRLRMADWFYREDPASVDCTLLDELAQDYGVTHVILDDDLLDLSCPQLRRVYRDSHFAIHRVAAP
jgi:hypothetical protein